MRILGFKTDHDGNVASVNNGALEFLIEAEKGCGYRHAFLTPLSYVHVLARLKQIPDVISIGGWITNQPMLAGYGGLEQRFVKTGTATILGKQVEYYSSSHERAHLFTSYGMSPFPAGTPCYYLLWEGGFGNFYEIDEKLNMTVLGTVMPEPGFKFAFLYHLADPTSHKNYFFDGGGKLMALASYSSRGTPTPKEDATIELLLSEIRQSQVDKTMFQSNPYYNIGFDSQELRELAGKLSDALFNRFQYFARKNMDKGYPLLIGGGCGLNCEWNSRWQECGLFPDVFVPPCVNDSGCAIGSALDAQHHFTGNPKLSWSVYAGEDFVIDCEPSGYEVRSLRMDDVAELLVQGKVLGWVQGRYEIGPRALGNRSLLGSPLDDLPSGLKMKDRLNEIKEREDYRPIAPVVMEEDMLAMFGSDKPSPHMLYLYPVISPRIPAVTHVDRTARVQSVNRSQNAPLYDLLAAFKQKTGIGVLCNTSLNFRGCGFINHLSSLVRYQRERNLDGFVVNDRLYIPQ